MCVLLTVARMKRKWVRVMPSQRICKKLWIPHHGGVFVVFVFSCGGFHSVFLSESNDVYSCGQNNYGEVFQEGVNIKVPKGVIKLFDDQNVAFIFAGSII